GPRDRRRDVGAGHGGRSSVAWSRPPSRAGGVKQGPERSVLARYSEIPPDVVQITTRESPCQADGSSVASWHRRKMSLLRRSGQGCLLSDLTVSATCRAS